MYSAFQVQGADTNYKMTVSGFQDSVGGTPSSGGDDLTYHSGQAFSTYDKDNDAHSSNCAVAYLGGWWYRSCHASNLNG